MSRPPLTMLGPIHSLVVCEISTRSSNLAILSSNPCNSDQMRRVGLFARTIHQITPTDLI